ncbi:MAG TPA: hypothetical protein VNM48_04910 [Chloroflexota bacterium]|nr:hypothetical protein [Chloroflexota bacterium]
MELSIEDRAVLAHVVPDPNAWVAHAIATVGEDAVSEKIDRHRAHYTAERAALGTTYRTKAAIDAAADTAARDVAQAVASAPETIERTASTTDLRDGAAAAMTRLDAIISGGGAYTATQVRDSVVAMAQVQRRLLRCLMAGGA